MRCVRKHKECCAAHFCLVPSCKRGILFKSIISRHTHFDKKLRSTIIPPWQTDKYNHHVWQQHKATSLWPGLQPLLSPLCILTSCQNDETLEDFIRIQHCVIETHLPWWMEPQCGWLVGGREMIRCRCKLLAASFVFLMRRRWRVAWKRSNCAVMNAASV